MFEPISDHYFTEILSYVTNMFPTFIYPILQPPGSFLHTFPKQPLSGIDIVAEKKSTIVTILHTKSDVIINMTSLVS